MITGYENSVDTMEGRIKHAVALLYRNNGMFCEHNDVHPVHLSQVINGKLQPNQDLLKALNKLGYNLHWILYGEGDMHKVN